MQLVIKEIADKLGKVWLMEFRTDNVNRSLSIYMIISDDGEDRQ
jgi:hypothetical protein